MALKPLVEHKAANNLWKRRFRIELGTSNKIKVTARPPERKDSQETKLPHLGVEASNLAPALIGEIRHGFELTGNADLGWHYH